MDDAARLADELFDVMLDTDPVNATLLGIPGRDHLLNDLSEEAQEATAARLQDIAARAHSLDRQTMSAEDRRTIAVVVHQTDAELNRIRSRAAEFTVTDLFIAPAAELLVMVPMAALPDAERAEAYLDRLAAIPAYLDQAAERHRMGVETGRVPVTRLVEAAVRQLDGYLTQAVDPFTTPTPDVPPPRFADRRDKVLAEAVRPAFARYRQVLAEEVAPHGRSVDQPGLCWLPNGKDTYAALARDHTTTDLPPEELHETGRHRMDALTREYVDIGGRALGVTDFPAILARLRDDRSLRWKDADELLAAARTAIARAEEAAPRWFGRLPTRSCVVAAAPESAGGGGPAGYYVPPSMDGAKPGTYYANTSRAEERDRYGIEAIAFHEAVPGHHLQLSLAQELTGLPMLRRTGVLTAYAEGWGLYVERLADEMGLYSDHVARLGMLSADSRRTARLVVDTGLHAFGWTREQAVSYLVENTTRPRVEIESDVDRFIALPGQALAYTVGQLEFQRIRANAERALGARFDVRRFHDVVLGSGSLPLPVLADTVAEWANVEAGLGEPGPERQAQ
ncbi:uncharacterized protein (DUF885 family) [Saccharothrix ecbatanensis]|uniref:Uncharacterized protein (DUF885 family) n=1 Tax=Saccharothrix ecbatanensis TaxID=1105145 RepID=A0A7W9M1E5_9PSEU|nr:DUF885 domain-containing protein [Saccharothrix ecbatanensis]MBB5803846.1 uncharacterized protein (DUF885 family) [Saccharothrix ecbatanensis]